MKPNLYRSSFVSFLLACAAPGSVPAFADTVFQFALSNTHVTAAQPFTRTATLGARQEGDPYVYTNAFSTASLSPASGYSGPAFYGGYQVSSSDQPLNLGESVRNNLTLSTDFIYVSGGRVSGDTTYSGTLSVAGVLLFDLEQPAASIDGFKAIPTEYGTAIADIIGRWVVGIGGSYYVSNATFKIPHNTSATPFSLEGETLGNTTWALYDPATDLKAPSSFTGLALEGVTAVGVHFERTQTLSDATAVPLGFGLGMLEVTGSFSIPEPSTLALLSGLLALGVTAVRRTLRSPLTRR
ncbi:MAG: PEP-CTERM sorting domain-containing protein [Opitutaceae bacterium]|jgi:hypothetical protein|nr:PEP-CTERM sorting domain-containing protein [Opitutaceae bacterium]